MTSKGQHLTTITLIKAEGARLLENANAHRKPEIPDTPAESAFQARPHSHNVLKEVRLKSARPVPTPNLPTSCGHEEARGSPAESECFYT